MNFKERVVLFVASGCCAGYIPFAPGTMGSIAALPLPFFLSGINLYYTVPLILIFIIFSVVIADHAEKIIKKKDPGLIVIDEIAGIIITFAGIPLNVWTVIAGFLIFRLFDIFKPFPIRLIEKKIPGGAGIVLDDVAAGILSNIVLRIGMFIVLQYSTR
ncbi:phosphatidylglycerophosphatase A [Desulfosarcina sp. BuS5]|uniref:phosphatidylglycerophosphatase A family protein n=1 Tax=Desulfosarcina sp. BuS5 TaxID=933262 RepID=UPI0004865FA5|nr:phosphatidylglycerophosphatase A [Desulfosarcina sp. BuS5]WDN89017.1 phosphatidylglycerophosphatase A [Desulfosarcina sp. BuS5]